MAHPAAHHHRRWKIQAPLGLALFGFGLCLVGEATELKHAPDAITWQWVSFGTFALVVTNAGLSILADAAKHRALFEWKSEQNE